MPIQLTMTVDQREALTSEHMVERLRRLTSSELRLLSLAIRGRLRHVDLAETLGVSPGNIASAMQRIRRKLAVPRHVDLAAFTDAHPRLKTEITAQLAQPGRNGRREDRSERRQLHLLRATIDELAAVAVRARERADDLDTEGRLGDHERRMMEIDTIRRVAEIVDAAVQDALVVARTATRDASARDRVSTASADGATTDRC